MSKLLNYIHEQVDLTKIRFNRTMNLRQVFEEIIAVGAASKLPQSVVDACLLIPAFSKLRVNVHHAFDIPALQALSSAEAVRNAVLYASLPNPTKSLWDDTAKVDGQQLQSLRTIDTLYALASELPTDDHYAFARQANLTFKSQVSLRTQLDAAYMKILQQGRISDNQGAYVRLADVHILVFIASVAVNNSSTPVALHVFDVNDKPKSFFITASRAQEMIRLFQEKLYRLHSEHQAFIQRISQGELFTEFRFTSLV